MVISSAETEVFFNKVKSYLAEAKSEKDLYEKIVNGAFLDRRMSTLLGLGITVLLLVNKQDRTIDRIALSDTDLAQGTLDVTVKPFRAIKIPLSYKGNFIAEAIRSGRYQQTSDWQYLFAPALKPEEARLNQAGGGIGCSFIYPLVGVPGGGAMIFSYFITLDKIEPVHRELMFRYTKLVAESLQKKK